jgi:peptidoglycan/xylan/chitin deacetylase (PgdA/CDA1 family)
MLSRYRNYLRAQTTGLLLAIVLAATIAACGTSTQPEATPQGNHHTPLPSIGITTADNGQEPTLRHEGADFSAASQVTRRAASAEVNAAVGVAAWAAYQFGPLADGQLPAELAITAESHGGYWVGWADYEARHWQLEGPYYGDATVNLMGQASGLNKLSNTAEALIICFDGASATVDAVELTYEWLPNLYVRHWPGEAVAAVSLTYDDGTEDHWLYGMDLWDDYGFRVTLGIIGSTFADNPERLPQLVEAHEAGHELANHTWSHPDLTTLDPAEVEAELDNTTALMENNVPGLDVVTAVYPYQMVNPTVAGISAERFLFGRGGDHDIGDVTPLNDPASPDYFDLYSFAVLESDMMPVSKWNGAVDDALGTGKWLIEQLHGINDYGWMSRDEADYRAHFDYIAAQGDALWVAPLAEVGYYLQARQSTRFIVTDYNPDYVAIEIADGLSERHWRVPLTLNCYLPSDWPNPVIYQQGHNVAYTRIGDNHIVFDAHPGPPLYIYNQPEL